MSSITMPAMTATATTNGQDPAKDSSGSRWVFPLRLLSASGTTIALCVFVLGVLHVLAVPLASIPPLLLGIGWTVCGFIPLTFTLFVLMVRVMLGRGTPTTHAALVKVGELSVGLGLLGTLSGFLGVASGSLSSAAPEEMLPCILAGMSSTFVGIALNLWALCVQHPLEVQEVEHEQ
jgi:hypothetical protein